VTPLLLLTKVIDSLSKVLCRRCDGSEVGLQLQLAGEHLLAMTPRAILRMDRGAVGQMSVGVRVHVGVGGCGMRGRGQGNEQHQQKCAAHRQQRSA
jgi:hypothetical protein